MSLRGALALLCAGIGSTLSTPLQARETRSKVALVREASDDRLLREVSIRLRAELFDAGFEVIDVDRAPGDPRADVETAANGDSSFATVAMNRAPNGAFADIWINDRVTGKTVVRRLQVGDGANATNVLAIRALELLRASLLEVGAKAVRAEPQRSAPKDVIAWIAPALPPPESPVLRGNALGVGVFALDGLGKIGLALGPTLEFSHGLGAWFGRVMFAAPLVGPELRTSAGSATIRQELAALAFGVATEPKPFGVEAWLGVGGFDLHTSGSAAPPYRGTSGDVVSFSSSAGIGGLLRLAPRVALNAEFAEIMLEPRPIVVIAGADAGKVGAPSLAVALGILVGL
ncbi:MAG TPA: hypothetical protein VHV51_02830 [Polyangiaceae bacterium]|jgi:hypothetical protein|nr:hypothetical protein [Polyangiaceae bacterium]